MNTSVQRCIAIYIKEADSSDHEIKEEVFLNIPLDELKRIVTPEQDDPLLYEGYILNKEQLDSLKSYTVSEIGNPDFEAYLYVLECWAS